VRGNLFGVETWEGAVSIICVNGILPFTYISKLVLRARPVPLWTLSIFFDLSLIQGGNVKAVGSLVVAMLLKVGHSAQRSSAIEEL
jgi:hypothetical protein